MPHKIFKRLIYAHVEPTVDLLFPSEQAGFQRIRSTTDQFFLLTQDMEDSFLTKKEGWNRVTQPHASASQTHRQVVTIHGR